MHLPAIHEATRRQSLRARFIDPALLSDASWNMLLELAAARLEHRRVYVTELVIVSGRPHASATRWINKLVEAGLFIRAAAKDDRRRSWVALTDGGWTAMAGYFGALAGRMAA